jgi:class 3 adenylate cyclase
VKIDNLLVQLKVRHDQMSAGSEQRKLAAIMFTDMVGYSALSQRDDKLALELLEEHRELLREISSLQRDRDQNNR